MARLGAKGHDGLAVNMNPVEFLAFGHQQLLMSKGGMGWWITHLPCITLGFIDHLIFENTCNFNFLPVSCDKLLISYESELNCLYCLVNWCD